MPFIESIVNAVSDVASNFLQLNVAGVSIDGLITIGVVVVGGLYVAKKLGYSISLDQKK